MGDTDDHVTPCCTPPEPGGGGEELHAGLGTCWPSLAPTSRIALVLGHGPGYLTHPGLPAVCPNAAKSDIALACPSFGSPSHCETGWYIVAGDATFTPEPDELTYLNPGVDMFTGELFDGTRSANLVDPTQCWTRQKFDEDMTFRGRFDGPGLGCAFDAPNSIQLAHVNADVNLAWTGTTCNGETASSTISCGLASVMGVGDALVFSSIGRFTGSAFPGPMSVYLAEGEMDLSLSGPRYVYGVLTGSDGPTAPRKLLDLLTNQGPTKPVHGQAADWDLAIEAFDRLDYPSN